MSIEYTVYRRGVKTKTKTMPMTNCSLCNHRTSNGKFTCRNQPRRTYYTHEACHHHVFKDPFKNAMLISKLPIWNVPKAVIINFMKPKVLESEWKEFQTNFSNLIKHYPQRSKAVQLAYWSDIIIPYLIANKKCIFCKTSLLDVIKHKMTITLAKYDMKGKDKLLQIIKKGPQ